MILALPLCTFSFMDAILKFKEDFKKEEVFGILKRKQAVKGGLLFLEIKYFMKMSRFYNTDVKVRHQNKTVFELYLHGRRIVKMLQ